MADAVDAPPRHGSCPEVRLAFSHGVRRDRYVPRRRVAPHTSADRHSPRRREIGHYACVTAGVEAHRSIERLANSVRRAPYVWLAACILWMLLLNSAVVPIAPDPGQGSTALAVVGAVCGAVGLVAWVLVGTPYFSRGSSAAIRIVMRWIFAVTPGLFAFATVAAGAEQWVIFFGFLTSVTLLVISARWTKRASVSSATP